MTLRFIRLGQEVAIPKYIKSINHVIHVHHSLFVSELDVCIYLMSAVGVKMEVEDGASATASELVRI